MVVMSQPAFNLQSTTINQATSGMRTLVPAQTVAGVSKSIKIWGLFITATAAQTITMYDGSAPFGGAMSILTNTTGQVLLPICTMPWWVLSPGNAFILNLGASTQISGIVVWSI